MLSGNMYSPNLSGRSDGVPLMVLLGLYRMCLGEVL